MSYGDYRQSCLERKYDQIPEKPSNGKKRAKKDYQWTVVRKRKDGKALRFGLGASGRHFVKIEDAEIYKSKSEREWNRITDEYLFDILPYGKIQKEWDEL